MDPPHQLTPNDHDGRSKRRRTNVESPADSPAITHIVPAPFHSPLAAAAVTQSQQNDPSQADADGGASTDDDLLNTQPPCVAGTAATSLSSPELPNISVPTPKTTANRPVLPSLDDEFSDWSESDLDQILQTQDPSVSAPASNPSPPVESSPRIYYAKTTQFEALDTIPEAHKEIISNAIADLYLYLPLSEFQMEGTNHTLHLTTTLPC